MAIDASVTVETSAGVTRITLNRPAQYNALNLAVATELLAAVTACGADPSVRVVVLTGAGSKAFCAGGDVPTFAANAARIRTFVRELTDPLHLALSRLARMDAVVIAAVNGATAGAGLGFVGVADLVVAEDHATFASAYTALGVTPDAGTSYHLTRILGPRRAAELILTNRVLTAREALEWGLVNRVIPTGELGLHVAKLAEQLARGPALAHAGAKRLIRAAVDDQFEAQLEREAASIARLMAGADGQEGVAAFLGKRKPVFGQGGAGAMGDGA